MYAKSPRLAAEQDFDMSDSWFSSVFSVVRREEKEMQPCGVKITRCQINGVLFSSR